jgi:hypothetical protein
MSRTQMQHVHNDCNMIDKQLQHEGERLQHAKNIVATPIYNTNPLPLMAGTQCTPCPHYAFSPDHQRRARQRGRAWRPLRSRIERPQG